MKKTHREFLKILRRKFPDIVAEIKVKTPHSILTLTKGDSVKVTNIPNTPSDYRWINNQITYIRSVLNE